MNFIKFLLGWVIFMTIFSGVNWIIKPESVIFAFVTGLHIGLTLFYANLLNDED